MTGSEDTLPATCARRNARRKALSSRFMVAGAASSSRVKDFPRGLGGIYASEFERYFPDIREYRSRWRPILEVMFAAREPLTLDDLAAIFGWSVYEMREPEEHFGSLFPVTKRGVRPFHRSLPEWLTQSDRSGSYYVSVDAGDRRLAEFGCQQYQRGVAKMRHYSVVHTPVHLASSGCYNELRKLLFDFDWLYAKLETSDVSALLADYDLFGSEDISSQLSSSDLTEVHEALRLIRGAIQLSAHALASDKNQLTGQLLGRLRGIGSNRIELLLDAASRWKGAPCLRPATASLTAPGGSTVCTLAGHSDWVTAVAVTPDGRLAISASNDKTLKVWNLKSGRELRTLKGHPREVTAVAANGSAADGEE